MKLISNHKSYKELPLGEKALRIFMVIERSEASAFVMKEVENCSGHHFLSLPAYERKLFKIIFTKAGLRTDRTEKDQEFLIHIASRTPVLEVRLNLVQRKVIVILDPPEQVMYENIPVPIF